MSIMSWVVASYAPGRLSRVYRDRENAAWKLAADVVERDIRNGTYPVGTRLPSIRQLAESLDIGHSTVQRVIRHLTAIGMVEPRHGLGVVIVAQEGRPPHTLADVLEDHESRIGALEQQAARIAALEEQLRQLRGDR